MGSYTLLPKILNMSLTGGIVIVLVLLIRLPLRKAPKLFSYALWAVVLFRLLCPVSFSSDFSLLHLFHSPTVTENSIIYIPTDIAHNANQQVNLPISGVSNAVNDVLIQSGEQAATNPLEEPMAIATLLWLAGIAAMLIYSVISLLKLKRKLTGAVRLRGNIYLADHIATPFVIGVIRPKIYLPSALSEREQDYIILHEQTHLRRLDHIVKLVAFLTLSIHWFNLLVWAAFVCCMKDMEMSCDEAVMEKMGGGIRADYSASLLSLATGRKILAGAPLAFGEGNTKSRIKNVLSYRKPAFWIMIAALIACIAAAVCLLSNPKANDDTAYENSCAEQLFDNRTAYVGNNSAVANIVGLLDFPSDAAYDHIELQTDSEPYGVEVYFSVTPEVKAAYDTSEPENINVFRKNACIMLSLIENADVITFRLDDDTEDTTDLQFTREWAERIVGTDLWAESGSAEDLDSLIAQISASVESAYAAAVEAPPEGTFTPADMVYWGLWHNVTADGFLESNADRIFKIDSGLFCDGAKEYGVQYAAMDLGDGISTFDSGSGDPFAVDVSGYGDKAGWRVLTSGGSDTGYRIFRMDDELWIGHWDWYGSDHNAWWCEYIFRVDEEQSGGEEAASDTTAAERAQAVINSVVSGGTTSMTLTASDGVGGGRYEVSSEDGNGPNRVVNFGISFHWTDTEGGLPASPDPAYSLKVESPDGTASLQCWQGSDLVLCTLDGESFRLSAGVLGSDAVFDGTIFTYLRFWYDEAEISGLRGDIVIPDEGQSDQEIAQAWAEAEEEAMLRATPGSKYACTYVKTTASINEDAMDSWYPDQALETEHFYFNYSTVFVPENDRARNWMMAGNTVDYEGSDAPAGALEYFLMGPVYLTEEGWRCDGVGTGP